MRHACGGGQAQCAGDDEEMAHAKGETREGGGVVCAYGPYDLAAVLFGGLTLVLFGHICCLLRAHRSSTCVIRPGPRPIATYALHQVAGEREMLAHGLGAPQAGSAVYITVCASAWSDVRGETTLLTHTGTH